MAWSLVIAAIVGVLCIALVTNGLGAAPVLTIGAVAMAGYGYVVYKRYRVEVVPRSDLKLFDDEEDLRILCKIYGLDATGGEGRLRQRLEGFARAHEEEVFVWVLPRWASWAVALETSSLGASDLAESLVSENRRGPRGETKPLLRMGTMSAEGSRIKICPICDARAPLIGATCRQCGADLSFYAALSTSRIGRKLMDEKASAVRRKLR